MKKNSQILFFDFDGTIADTKSLYYNELAKTVKIFGYKYKDIDKALDVGLSLRKTLKKIGLGFISSLIAKRKIMKNVKEKIASIKKCKDTDSIKNIKQKKIIVTNSLKEFVIPLLKHLKLKKYFDKIYGVEDFDDKADFIKQYIKNTN